MPVEAPVMRKTGSVGHVPSIPFSWRCSTTARESTSRPAPAATAACRSGARPTSPRAGPTAATAAGAATSCSWPTTGCATCSPSAAAPTSRPSPAATARATCATAPRATSSRSTSRRARWSRSRTGRATTCSRRASGRSSPAAARRAAATSASPARPVRRPRFRERGLAGTEGWVELQLKLLADVGLVGLPNAGKSSLLARITRAQPKVGGYPFTTLEPDARRRSRPPSAS